jgi:penicillin-binding protein 1C
VRNAAASALAALAILAGAALLWRASEPPAPPPDLAAIRARFASSEGVLLDRHGALLHEARVDLHGRRLAWTPLTEIARPLREAVVASEDRRFRSHGGVDWLAIAGALRDAARGGPRRGASTLSMQLAALIEPSLRAAPSARGALAKLRQMRAARALEARLGKDAILEAYLNLASFRGELQGVAAASRGLFDRDPHGLGAAEAALLAALLPAPNAPLGAVARRACRIAARGAAESSCEAVRSLAQRALAAAPRVRPAASLAPHLAARLLRPADPSARRVTTTLDARLQALVADVLRRQVLELRGRNVRDAAALVADNATGEVLAWVGGVGELGSAAAVDGVRARRQAGSTLKPFLYARALDRRLVTAATRLDDAPLDVVTPAGSYRPENYDRAFRGLVPAREALASSLNVPAVRLLQLVGVEDFVGRLRALGFASLERPDFYGGSLALGSADVSLLELVGAYRALAAGGVYTPLRVEPGARDDAPPAAPALSAAAAFVVADVLSDRASRAPTFGLESPLATRVWSAVKTGTSKDLRDNWCLGFTRRYSVGVWLGNFSGEPMWDVSGVDGAAPAWLAIVHALHEDVPSEAPPPPPGVVRAGGEWYLAGSEPAALAAAPPSPREARIVAPEDGLVLALDPDIPASRERLLLEASPRDPSLALRLDGRPLGSAGAPLLWALERGRHALALVGPEGRVVHSVRFEVR